MSVRELPGYDYQPIPGYGKSSCRLCGRPGCRCEALPTRKPCARYKPGICFCGSCWEDSPAGTLLAYLDPLPMSGPASTLRAPRPSTGRQTGSAPSLDDYDRA